LQPRSSKPPLRDILVVLFDSIRVDAKDPGYRDSTGKYFEGGKETIWTEPLGKKVLIVDIDTRVPTGENGILNPDTLDWESLEMSGGGLVSSAVMNHYLYAQIHGYDYKLYSARHIADHYDTWIMPHAFHELVPSYDFVVAMDADVTVSHLEIPLEWLFNRWGISRTTSMALPWDTEEMRNNESISTDSQGLRVLNTGFVVAQNLPTTMDMLAAWKDCTSETRYPGCGRWKQEWSHEQRAFSEYIRYDFNRTPETIVSIACDDAIGWPGFVADADLPYPISDCNGNFLRHHTLRKSKVKESATVSVMQAMSQILQKAVLRNQRELWYVEPEVVVEEEDDGEKKDDGLVVDTRPTPQEVREDAEFVPILEEGVY
jgi:hypothetical protein